MPESESRVVLIDLDGTLLMVSSFKVWGRMLLTARASAGCRIRRLVIAPATAIALLARRAGLIDHARLRATFGRWWRWSTDGDNGVAARALWAALDAHLRPELRPLLHEMAAGERDGILATAASAAYADAYARHLGFRHVIASRGRVHDDGVAKRDAVLDLMATLGWAGRPLILLTDGIGDAPLARHCAEVWWFGDPAQASAFSAAAGGVPITLGGSSRQRGDAEPT